MRRLLLSAIIVCGLTGFANAEPHDVFGTFMTQDGSSHIHISDCGDGSPCGKVVWIDPATLEPGETPDTVVGLTGEPVLGLTLLKGFQRVSKDWRKGTVYDPENDKMYAARLRRLEDGNLQLKGCLGPFCQTQVWTVVRNTIVASQ